MIRAIKLITCFLLSVVVVTDTMADIISAPIYGSTNAAVRFEFNAEGLDSESTFHWDFDDGTTLMYSKSRRTETQWAVHRFDKPGRYWVKLTVTVGFATGGLDAIASLTALYKEADEALYEAKNKRNSTLPHKRQVIGDLTAADSVKAKA